MKRPLTPPPNTPPRRKTPPPKLGNVWLSHQMSVFLASLGHLLRSPLASLMTASVIGIALALPTGLYLLLENVRNLSYEWDSSVQISLFLKQEVDEAKAHILADQLLQRPEISNVQIITPVQALQEYRNLSGFGEALTALETNPLPFVLIVQLATNDTQAGSRLLEQLGKMPEVEVAQFDMLWLKRLFTMIEIIRRGVLILATLLSLAVLLVIGNTIRLAIYNRREEIEIYKLFGATNAFIRSPFLYLGFWYGLSGGAIAWGIVDLSFWLLQTPIKQLTALYHSQFQLVTLDLISTPILLLTSALLGITGAWLAVGRHLKEIQPN